VQKPETNEYNVKQPSLEVKTFNKIDALKTCLTQQYQRAVIIDIEAGREPDEKTGLNLLKPT